MRAQRLLSLVATASAFASIACTTPAPVARSTAAPAPIGDSPMFSSAPSADRVTLIHLSDTEAGILADDRAVGGVARTRAIIDAAAARSVHPLVLHGGDSIIPSPELSLELDGKSAIVLGNNLLPIRAFGLGNHELDLGEGFYADVVKATPAPIITCTLDVRGGPLAELVVKDLKTTPWVEDVKGRIVPRAKACAGAMKDGACDGVVVGIVGATTEQLRSISKGASENLVLPADRAAVVGRIQAQVDALQVEGIHHIVLLSHLQGVEHELDLVKRGLTGVDVMVSAGGEHHLATSRQRLLDDDRPDRVCRRLDGPCYPIAQRAADGQPVLIVATGGGMRYVGNVVMDFDASGHLTGVAEPASRPIPVDETALMELRATTNTEALAFELRVRHELQPLLKVVGHTDVFLEGAREAVRNRETNLGDVSADAILAAARAHPPAGTDPRFALRNAGALRASIGAVDVTTSEKTGGDVRLIDVKSALRFDSRIVVVTLTHKELRNTLEASLIGAGTTRGHFPQVSDGVFLSYATRPAPLVPLLEGGRVVGIKCGGRRVQQLVVPGPSGPITVVKDGETQDPQARVTLATIDYLSGGGDGWFPGQKVQALPVLLDSGEPATDQVAFTAFLQGSQWRGGARYVDPRDAASGMRIQQQLSLEDSGEACPTP